MDSYPKKRTEFLKEPYVNEDGQQDDIVWFSKRIQNQLNQMPSDEQHSRVTEATERISDLYQDVINKKHLFLYSLLAYRFYFPEDESHIGTVDEYRNIWVEGLVKKPSSVVIQKPTIVLPFAQPKVSFFENGEYIDQTIDGIMHVPIEYVTTYLT